MRTLSQCESVIERGLASYREVGAALKEIRDNRLYRASHATFEDYCLERWAWTPQHTNRTIAAGEVAEVLEPMGSIPAPTTERVARELAPLRDQPEAMARVMQRATEQAQERAPQATKTPQPTAAIVRRLVKAETIDCLTPKMQDVLLGVRDLGAIAREIAPQLIEVDRNALAAMSFDELDQIGDSVSAARRALKILGHALDGARPALKVVSK